MLINDKDFTSTLLEEYKKTEGFFCNSLNNTLMCFCNNFFYKYPTDQRTQIVFFKLINSCFDELKKTLTDIFSESNINKTFDKVDNENKQMQKGILLQKLRYCVEIGAPGMILPLEAKLLLSDLESEHQ